MSFLLHTNIVICVVMPCGFVEI